MGQHSWQKPAIKSTQVACICCGGTEAKLDLGTVLYTGFGGWHIRKDGVQFYAANDYAEFQDCKTVADIEAMIGDEDDSEYLAVAFLPLRGATYQRHSRNHWVLIDENEGFA